MSASEHDVPEHASGSPKPEPSIQVVSMRTASAARMLGVHPSMLRRWEQLYRFPLSHLDADGRRQFATHEILALRDALTSSHSLESAMWTARR